MEDRFEQITRLEAKDLGATPASDAKHGQGVKKMTQGGKLGVGGGAVQNHNKGRQRAVGAVK